MENEEKIVMNSSIVWFWRVICLHAKLLMFVYNSPHQSVIQEICSHSGLIWPQKDVGKGIYLPQRTAENVNHVEYMILLLSSWWHSTRNYFTKCTTPRVPVNISTHGHHTVKSMLHSMKHNLLHKNSILWKICLI